MKTGEKQSAITERIDLLSSPALENDQVEDLKKRKKEEEPPCARKQMRFRDRLYSLFNARTKPQKNAVDGGTIAEHERKNDENDSQDSDSVDDDEDDDEEIKQLKKIIKEQEEILKNKNSFTQGKAKEEHSTSSSGSSLVSGVYDEETYQNTIRNANLKNLEVPSLDKEEKEEELPNVPLTKLFLSYYPEQARYYKLEKSLIDQGDYQLLYSWNVWRENKNCKTPLRLESKIDFIEILKAYQERFESPQTFEVHFFREDFKPNRNSNLNGKTLAFQIPQSRSYKIWKELLRIFLDDKFFHSDDLRVYNVKNSVIGLSFYWKRYKEDAEKSKGNIMLVKVWILGHGDPVKVCELLRINLPYQVSKCIVEAKCYNNDQMRPRLVYSKSNQPVN